MIKGQQTSQTSQTGCDAGVPTGVDGLHEAFVRGLNQLLRLVVHVSDEERFIQVAMETVVVDRDVNCANNNSAGVTTLPRRLWAQMELKYHKSLKMGERTVEDVPVLQQSPVWDAVTDDLVDGRAARFGKVVVVERGGVAVPCCAGLGEKKAKNPG